MHRIADVQLAVKAPESMTLIVSYSPVARENHAFQLETSNFKLQPSGRAELLLRPDQNLESVPLSVPDLPALYGLFRDKKIPKYFFNDIP